MKRFIPLLIIVIFLVSAIHGAGILPAKAQSATIPTISIVSVVGDQSVTIRTHNFPANQTFTARMGAMGTRGVGGIVVGTTQSGAGGSFLVTYDIPASLRGSSQIAIRLESPQGYFSYNWFVNTTVLVSPSPTPAPGISRDTNNFPPNQGVGVGVFCGQSPQNTPTYLPCHGDSHRDIMDKVHPKG
jgi:hypothetical protein